MCKSMILANLECCCLLVIIFADHAFIDPTFFGIFVCGPLQSFMVNVCIIIIIIIIKKWFISWSKMVFKKITPNNKALFPMIYLAGFFENVTAK